MPSTFPGFSPDALKFFRALKRNNDREWFGARKEQFDALLRQPMLELIGQINTGLMRFAPDYVAEPSKAVFRIYRDTRFSNDKTPYKTHIAAVFSHRTLPRNHGSCFYFQISAEKVGVGGGIYQPPPDLLRLIRGHIAENPETYSKIIGSLEKKKTAGKFEGQPLTRVPKGFDANHPAAELLKCRSLFFYDELPPETGLGSSVLTEIVGHFRAISGFVEQLNRPILGHKKFTLTDTM